MVLRQPEEQADDPGGVRLGELVHELDPPRGANASISSLAIAWNVGRISAMTRFLNAGTISFRIRAWSSPSS